MELLVLIASLVLVSFIGLLQTNLIGKSLKGIKVDQISTKQVFNYKIYSTITLLTLLYILHKHQVFTEKMYVELMGTIIIVYGIVLGFSRAMLIHKDK